MIQMPIRITCYKFNIVLIGAGGTGGNLAPMIARLISGNDNVSLTIVDGDFVEISNLERQPYLEFDVGKNKAETLSVKLNTAFNLKSTYFPEYITTVKNLEMLCKSDSETLTIIVGAVDNHQARVLMERFFSVKENIIYIDSANEDYFGDVILSLKFKGETILNSRGMYRPKEIFKGTKRVKTTSCEIKNLDNPQYYPANQMAATIVLKMISDIVVEYNVRTHFVNFDTHDYLMFQGAEGIESDNEDTYQKFVNGDMPESDGCSNV